ncbi:FecR domain-containing protein [Orrella sp. JC864]|uniref:FecR family protein n=1 Tax=Orrella sp. JC864 TaxID=3120298 RepID=UPI003009D56D
MSAMTPPVPPGVRAAASQWAVRLAQGPLDARTRRRLDRWLAADPTHGPALADAEMAWALAGELRELALFAAPVPRVSRGLAGRRLGAWLGAGWSVRRLAPALAGCLLALMLGGAFLLGGDGWRALGADYRTAAGEIRPLRLADGSQVLLGSDSALDLDYGPKERRVRLLRGEAVFTPAPRQGAEQRPFVVEAAAGQTTALGTRFVVQRESAEQAWVGVLAHRTEVAMLQAPRSGERRLALEAGQAARYSPESGVVASQMDPQALADWAQGSLVFDQAPLARVVRRLDDFWPGRLVLLGRRDDAAPVTALVHLDNLEQALRALCTQFRLKRLSLPGMTLLY